MFPEKLAQLPLCRFENLLLRGSLGLAPGSLGLVPCSLGLVPRSLGGLTGFCGLASKFSKLTVRVVWD